MNISYIVFKKSHMKRVIELLKKNISYYEPKLKNYNQIWKLFSTKSNAFSIVALTNKKNIIGYGTIFLQYKIRGGATGAIEDIVVCKKYRKLGIGKKIINKLQLYAKKNKCYKLSLICKRSTVPFYKKCGLKVSRISMQKFI